MIAFLRRSAAVLLAALALPATATTFSPDYSDIWYTQGEDGHGVYIAQQGNSLFATIFVYGGDTLPRWYFGSDVRGTSQTQFSGTFFRTQGTSFNAPWNPGQLQVIAVGQITFNFSSPTSGTMTYTIDGILVTKNISRLTNVPNNLSGIYLGGLVASAAQCSSSTINGIFVADRLTVTHSPPGNPTFRVDFNPGSGNVSCTFTGTLVQTGSMGSITNGQWSCSGAANNAGTFTMTEIKANTNGITSKFTGRDQYCQSYNGYFGGIKDVL